MHPLSPLLKTATSTIASFVDGSVKDTIVIQCGVPDTKLAKGARRARIRRLFFEMWSLGQDSIIRLVQEDAVDMHDFRIEIQIHANIVAVLRITGHFPASQRLEEQIRKYAKGHNANFDGKIKAAEDGDEDAFFNNNPGLKPLKVNRLLLRPEVNRLKGLKVDEPTIPIIANPGEVPVDELSYAFVPKKEQIIF
ncbi:hypothetical protein LTR10_002513 [Elasticomyces elasticus]|nr:hypothetical protein LTR10_002513 [Elasticomyces elasticus]KAK4973427.1 hypothetical protein LTR42_005413 [Elasticomyces elasticus]